MGRAAGSPQQRTASGQSHGPGLRQCRAAQVHHRLQPPFCSAAARKGNRVACRSAKPRPYLLLDARAHGQQRQRRAMGRPSLPDSPAGASLQLRRCQSADLPGSRRSRHALLWRRPPRTFSYPWGVTVLCCRQGDKITLLQHATKEVQMTEGPMNWVSLKGHNHGEYWLLKLNRFHVDLDPLSKMFTGTINADIPKPGEAQGRVDLSAGPSLEGVIERAKPAVVRLKGFFKSGSGFFVTEIGRA